MSLYNTYDRTQQFAELLVPYDVGSGEVSAATQQANARKNLGIGPGGSAAIGSISSNGSIVSTSPSGGVGYAAGAGGAVTQGTSRTTGVTLNTDTGAITMFSAAGSATPASFTVTDSSVGANDVIVLSQKSGTNLYELFVTAVAAGSFVITFFTTGGVAVDAPVINFAIIKGAVA
jgi:hypothetical protein